MDVERKFKYDQKIINNRSNYAEEKRKSLKS